MIPFKNLLFALAFPISLSAQQSVQVERCHSFPGNEPVNCLHIEGENIWLGTTGGLFRYSYSTNRTNVMEGVHVTAITRDEKDRLWVALEDGSILSEDGKYRFSLPNAQFTPYVSQLTSVGDRLWIATAEEGVYVWDVAQGKHVGHYDSNHSKMASNTVNVLQRDAKGGVWVGTTRGAAYIEAGEVEVFEELGNITAGTRYDGDVWFIGGKKLWKVDQRGNWEQFQLDDRFASGLVRDIAFDNEGRLYSASDIFSRYDLIADTMAVYGTDYGYVRDKSLCVSKDGNGDIWAGTARNGLFRFKLASKERQTGGALAAICHPAKGLRCQGDGDGRLSVEVSGGQPPYRFQWNTEAAQGQHPANLPAGDYIVTVTDGAGSQVTAGASLRAPGLAVGFELVELKNTNGKDGKIEIKGTGGNGQYTYQWLDGATGAARTGLETGLYAVTIKDGRGCSLGANFEVKANAPGSVTQKEKERDAPSPPDPAMPALAKSEGLKVGETLTINQLAFDADSVRFRPKSTKALDEIYAFLKNNPHTRMEIGGHTNSLPSKEYCDWLSSERAYSVAKYLYGKGIPKTQLSYRGYGKDRPVSTNMTRRGRTENQRVEVKILSVE